MASVRYKFEIPGGYRSWSFILMGLGALSVIIGYILYGTGSNPNRFWATILQNGIYFLMISNAAMFFLCASTLALAGWHISLKRVPEAISRAVPVLGVIAIVILLILVFGHKVYMWTDKDLMQHDKVLKGKSAFLNPTFFIIWTLLVIGLWSFFGHKMRQLSRSLDNNPPQSVEESRRYVFKNTVWSALFILWFVLSVMSTAPWLWLMSIDAKWYSTMYSWYTFASTFVTGVAIITLFVVFLKNNGYLEFTNEEHIHDLGKYMFAFSIFWTYLWFSQYMLIWYANMPEETIYFKIRVQGPYKGIFFLNLIINFLAPFLILMKRSSKRNYTTITFVAVLLVFGHWLDFYQMVFPGLFPDRVPINLFDFGVALGFVGLIMFVTGRGLAKYPLIPRNDPFLKESIIHHT